MNVNARGFYLSGLVKAINQDFFGAINDFTSAIELDKLSAEIFIRRGQARMQTNDTLQVYEAHGDFFEAIIIEPQNAEAIAGLGGSRLLIFPNNIDGLKDLAKASKIETSEGSYWNIGIAKYYQGDYMEMINAFNNYIIFENPKNEWLGEAYYFKGLAYISMNDYRGAIINFSLALSNNANINYHEALFNRAVAYSFINETQEAIKDYTRFLAIKPNNLDALINRSKLFSISQDYEAELTDLQSAIILDPSNIDLLARLSDCLIESKKYDEAISQLTLLIYLQPDVMEHFQNRGVCYLAKQRYSDAINDFDNFIKADKSFGYAFYCRGMCHFFLENKQACNDWKTAYDLGFSEAKTLMDKHCVYKSELGIDIGDDSWISLEDLARLSKCQTNEDE